MLKDVKNKQGEVIGRYTPIEDNELEYKETTFEQDCEDKNGVALVKAVAVSKKGILHRAVKDINTDVRNYVAGLARPKKGTAQEKLLAYEAFFKEKGFDVSGIAPDKLISTLEEIKQAE